MPDKIVDASAVAAYLFDESTHEVITVKLRGCSLSAPTLIWSELANVCVKKTKQRPAEARSIFEAFQNRDSLNIDLVTVDMDAVVKLALSSGLSAYDASYLWLSRKLGFELVTLDKRLEAAAQSAA